MSGWIKRTNIISAHEFIPLRSMLFQEINSGRGPVIFAYVQVLLTPHVCSIDLPRKFVSIVTETPDVVCWIHLIINIICFLFWIPVLPTANGCDEPRDSMDSMLAPFAKDRILIHTTVIVSVAALWKRKIRLAVTVEPPLWKFGLGVVRNPNSTAECQIRDRVLRKDGNIQFSEVKILGSSVEFSGSTKPNYSLQFFERMTSLPKVK